MNEFAILGRPRGPPYFLWSLNMNQKITAFLFGLLGTTLLICSCILVMYFRQSSQQAALYSRLAASASHFDTGELTGEGSLLPEREELYEQNPDMVGWIQI